MMQNNAQTVPRRKPLPVNSGSNTPIPALASRGGAVLADDASKEASTRVSAPMKEAHTISIKNGSKSPSTLPRWVPFWLRREVLLAFIATFTALLISLTTLFAYSQTHRGLSTAKEKNYYLWTYGPTAVFTTVATLWAQVVYRMKQLMPWRTMAASPQPASKSVLLDYVSPIDPVALWTAARNSHHSVSLAVLSSFVLIAATISATGLCTLQPMEIINLNAPLTITSKFDMSNIRRSSIDSRPTTRVYGVTQFGLPYPSGTNAEYAVQDFFDPFNSNATLSGIVDAFSGWLECEPATFQVTNTSEYTPNGHLDNSGVTFTVNLTSPGCTVSAHLINVAAKVAQFNPLNKTYASTWGYGSIVKCIEDEQYRVLVSVGNVSVRELWNSTNNTDADGNYDPYAALLLSWNQMYQVTNTTNVLCTALYTIEESNVLKTPASVSQSILRSVTPVEIGRRNPKNDMDILRGVFQSINDPTNGLSYSNSSSPYINSEDNYFPLLALTGPVTQRGIEYWLQQANLIHHSNALYGAIAAQVAAMSLLVPTDERFHGVTTEIEPRLVVRTLSFAITQACLVVLILLATWILIFASDSVVTHDPGSVLGLATILSRSDKLVTLVDSAGTCEMSKHRPLSGNSYRTFPTPGTSSGLAFTISTYESTEAGSKRSTESSKATAVQWWQPATLKVFPYLLIVLLTIGYIIALQILLMTSQSRGGLVEVEDNAWIHYSWTYLPALCMVGASLAYGSISFNIRMFSPFSALSKGPVSAPLSVQDHPLARIALHELFLSISRRRLAIFTATLGALLSSLLTIAVAGLYTAGPFVQDAGVQQLTGWKFQRRASNTPNITLLADVFDKPNLVNPASKSSLQGFWTAANFLLTSDLPYPSWTYEELALPAIKLTDPHLQKNVSFTASGSLNVSLPAVRAGLNCSVVDQQMVSIAYATLDDDLYSEIMNSDTNWILGGNRPCLNYRGRKKERQATGECRVAFFTVDNSYTIGGCNVTAQAVFLPQSTDDAQPFGYFEWLGAIEDPESTSCPTYVGMFGRATINDVRNYTWFACSTYVESVLTRTTFNLPGYNITNAVPIESTVKSIPGEAEVIQFDGSSPVRFQGPNAALYGFDYDMNDLTSFYNVSDGQNYDSAFSTIVHGRDKVSVEDMIGPNNTIRLLSAVEHIFRIVNAQSLARNFISADPGDIETFAPASQQPWRGKFVDSTARRPQQSVVSTRILQGLLGTMTLCVIVTFLSMNTKRILPVNPLSIAAMAGLLAGSNMLSIAASSAVIAPDEEGKKSRDKSEKWDGYLFSLGWWQRSDGRRRLGIDIGNAEKAG